MLQLSVCGVRGLVERGELADVAVTARLALDPEQVVRVATDLAERRQLSGLAPFLARQLVQGRLTIPRPAFDAAPPPSLLAILDDFCAMQSTQRGSSPEFRA